MTNAEARFNKSLHPQKPEGSLGRTAQTSTSTLTQLLNYDFDLCISFLPLYILVNPKKTWKKTTPQHWKITQSSDFMEKLVYTIQKESILVFSFTHLGHKTTTLTPTPPSPNCAWRHVVSRQPEGKAPWQCPVLHPHPWEAGALWTTVHPAAV